MIVSTLIERSRREIEDWRFTNLEKLLPLARKAAAPTEQIVLPITEPTATVFVFVNGVLDSEQTQRGQTPACLLLGDAEQGYNLTLGQQDCLAMQPVELRFITTSDTPEEMQTKIAVHLGESGRLTLLERHHGTGTHVVQIDITLAAQAKLVHGRVMQGTAPRFVTTNVRVAKGAFYDAVGCVAGGALTRLENNVLLQGEMAQVSLAAVHLADTGDHLDIVTRIHHEKPQGSSRQLMKNIASGKGRVSFQGKVLVLPQAQKTDAEQMSRALLLSDQAEVNAKPELEIYADDVRCSHGSTVGDLDAEALFYMRARGIPEHEAKGLLTEAFIAECFERVSVAAWRDEFIQLAKQVIRGWRHEQI